MDSSIPTHLLAYWVREQQAMTMEAAVRKLTSAPAALWGFADRGLLREGFAADVNVIDPSTVGPAMPEVAYDFPTGARRLKQGSTGIAATIVAGRQLDARRHAARASSRDAAPRHRRLNRAGGTASTSLRS